MSSSLDKSVPPLPSLTTLSPSLLTTFGSLRGGGQRMYKALYGAVWRYLWPISRLSPIALACYLPVTLGSISPRLSVHCWFMLCRIWLLSGGGATAVNSRGYEFDSVDRKQIKKLMGHGLLIRTSFDPADPHAVRPSHINKTYISFTPAGIQYYRVVVEGINKAAQFDSFAGVSGTK